MRGFIWLLVAILNWIFFVANLSDGHQGMAFVNAGAAIGCSIISAMCKIHRVPDKAEGGVNETV